MISGFSVRRRNDLGVGRRWSDAALGVLLLSLWVSLIACAGSGESAAPSAVAEEGLADVEILVPPAPSEEDDGALVSTYSFGVIKTYPDKPCDEYCEMWVGDEMIRVEVSGCVTVDPRIGATFRYGSEDTPKYVRLEDMEIEWVDEAQFADIY